MKSNITWFDRDTMIKIMPSKILPTYVVLDIGCGISPQNYFIPRVHICCEPFKGYVEYLQEKVKVSADRYYLVNQMGWQEAVDFYPPKSVDTVFLLDIVEHLEKEEGLQLLKKTEQIARKQIVIFTPLGYIYQEHGDGMDMWGLEGAKWQLHKSGWTPHDFDESWDLYVSEKYHCFNNVGVPYDSPLPAMWAIKNIPDEMGKVNGDSSGNKGQIYTFDQLKNDFEQTKTEYDRVSKDLQIKVERCAQLQDELLQREIKLNELSVKSSAIQRQAVEEMYLVKQQLAREQSEHQSLKKQTEQLLAEVTVLRKSIVNRIIRKLKAYK